MNESILPVTPGLMSLLSKGVDFPLPFSQEIFLLRIVVAGTTHCKEIATVEPLLVAEKVLTMKREPDNKYDEFAIAIYCDNIKIGYMPAELNEVCSRLMDAGKAFFCRVIDTKRKGDWLKVNANIYMVE